MQADYIDLYQFHSGSVDMAAWALAWCLRHPAVTCVIPGCKNPGQVAANASAVELVAGGHPQEIAR